MITNKDLSIDSKNGQVVLNGNKYDLGTQGEIDAELKDVYSVMGQNGAKNLIPYPYVNTSQTINNVAFTVNGDGSISVDNAASGTTQFRLYGWTTGLSPLLLRKGTYILSGCPSGGGINSLRLYLHNQDSSFSVMDDGEGKQFTLSDDTYVGIAIRVANGYDADGKTVYPMLRLAADTDNTYQPYAKTNRQLTEAIGDLSQTGVTGDTVAAQLTTAFDKVKRLTPVEKNYTCQSTNLEYTGISIACPAGHVYIVRAQLSYSSSAPDEILISSSFTAVQKYLTYASSDKSSYATFMLITGETAYIWGKWAEANKQNVVRYNVIDITI